jgi:tetratricopeptide (TPR) repeat protein
MKNKILFTILLAGMCIGSCKEDFIALSPNTVLNTTTFFKSSEQFQQALIGVYQSMRGWSQPSSWMMGECRSDNSRYDFNPQNRGVAVLERENICDWTNDALNSVTKSKYTAAYVGIERANIILDQIATADIDEATKKSVTGEAEVLRAFFYFDLVQFFGDLPLNLHTVKSPADAFLPRSPVADVYAAIIADLTDAIQKLPQTVTFPQTGRVTIATAKTLLADVYMVQKKWDLAQQLLQDVTKLGFKLNTTYASAFSTTNKNSVESIFEVQYQMGAANGQASSFIYDFIPPMASTTAVTGVNTNTTNSVSGQNVPSQDLIDSYEAGDTRLDVSIGVIEGHYATTGLVIAESLKSIIGYSTPTGKISRRFVKKYLHPSTDPGQTDDNWPIYRYAEVLLSLAECLNEQGNSAQALPYLNQVRSRAGLAASTQTDKTLLRAVIAHERRIELAFENKRWKDLLRTGQAIPVMTAYGAKIRQITGMPANAYTNVDANHLLFPIPSTEIQLNPQITQNPGY